MKRCMYCGHENEDTLVSCSVCGNKLGNSVPTQEPVTGEEAALTPDISGEAAPVQETPSGSDSTVDFSEPAPGADVPKEAERAASDEQTAADEAMVTQEPAFAGQIPVNSQFGDTAPAGQFQGGENTYAGQPVASPYAGAPGQPVASPYAGAPGQPVENPYAGAPGQPVENPYAGTPGQYTGENPYTGQGPDMTPGYGEDWRQDVGRGQTYGARTQYEARREARRAQGTPREGVSGGVYTGNNQYGASGRDQYGSTGYGYRQPQGQEQPQGVGRGDYGRRESAGGSKMFMVKARKRVKSVTFFLMALAFTAMFALNVYNIYCGNALRNITDSESMLANILSGTGTNFFTQMLTELASQMVKMVVNVQEIIAQLGRTVELGIAIVFLVPNVLYCLALWLMFFRTDTKRRQFPMGGYTLARVMMILKFLIACLVLAVGLVISVYFVVVGAQRKSGGVDSSLIQGVILLIVMIVVSIFVVMYYIQWMFCLKVVRDNAKKGTDPGRMPGFVVFLSVMCAAICVVLMIPMAPNDYIGLASRGAAAAYFLISGLWVLIYKIRVKRN